MNYFDPDSMNLRKAHPRLKSPPKAIKIKLSWFDPHCSFFFFLTFFDTQIFFAEKGERKRKRKNSFSSNFQKKAKLISFFFKNHINYYFVKNILSKLKSEDGTKLSKTH
jgi:hypothetical protein